MNPHALSANLKVLMQSRENLSEAQLARELNIPQPTLHRLMNGSTANPTIMTLLPIAEYFRVSLDQLYGLEPLDLGPANFQSRKSYQVPLIPWQQVHECPALLRNITSSTWSDWVTTNLKLNADAFALQVISQAMPLPYSYGSIHIIEPCESINETENKTVIVCSTTSHSTCIRKVYIDDDTFWLLPVNKRLPPEKFDGAWQLSGVIRQHILTVNP